VLFDRCEGEFLIGRTQWDAPEIDQEVYVRRSGGLAPGNFVSARIVDATEYDLYGELHDSSH
jgi:ribosomal protein S12 methylthiotransferase